MILASLALLFTLQALAEGGDHVGNGGGLSESRLAYAALNIAPYFKFCAQTDLCKLSNDEKTVVASILDQYLKIQSPVKLQLTYVLKGLQDAVFSTSPPVGSPVVINRDLIYPHVVGSDEKRALTQIESIGLITQVLIQQAGGEFAVGISVSEKIEKSFNLNSTEKSLAFLGFPEVSVQHIRIGLDQGSLLINGADQTLDITSHLNQSLQAAIVNNNLGTVCQDTDVTANVVLSWADSFQINGSSFNLRSRSSCMACETRVEVNLKRSTRLRDGSDPSWRENQLTLDPQAPFVIKSSTCRKT